MESTVQQFMKDLQKEMPSLVSHQLSIGHRKSHILFGGKVLYEFESYLLKKPYKMLEEIRREYGIQA